MLSAVARFLWGSRSSSRPEQTRARLTVEAMESRLVLSTSPVGLLAPIPADSVQVGTATPVAPDNQGGIIAIAPDTPVYGYKHRKRWPYDAALQQVPTIALVHIDVGQIPSSPPFAPLS